MEISMDAALLNNLRALDTPTVCNALSLLLPDERSKNFTKQSMVCVPATSITIVGFAKTVRVRSTRPTLKSKDEYLNHRIAYWRYLASGPTPIIAVVQDLDREQRGWGSFWGEVNSNIHAALGCVGAVTDGSVRDVNSIASDFNILATRLAPSAGYIHIVDFDVDVEVAGMVTRSGDLVHADQHGAVIIPHGIAREVVGAASIVSRKEALVINACKDRQSFSVSSLAEAIVAGGKIG